MTTLEEAKKEVRQKAEDNKGALCPCCGKLVKVYRRRIHAEMARFLILLFKKYTKYPRFYSMRELYPTANKAASDGSYLVHWGLIERSETREAPAGYYRPTDKGLRFVHGRELVLSHVHLFNNEVVGWSNCRIDIRQSLGEKFDYDELMKE